MLQFVGHLHGRKAFGFHLVHVALHGYALLLQCSELVFVALQQCLQVAIKSQTFVNKQDAEVKVVHPLAYLVERNVCLRLVYLLL